MKECNGRNNQHFISRRDLLYEAGKALAVSLSPICSARTICLGAPANAGEKSCVGSAGVTDSPFLPKPSHFKARAKSVISLFMSGGVSHVDTFDYKPMLEQVPWQAAGRTRRDHGAPGLSLAR